MKIIDASKLIQWIQKNNNGDEGVKMWPLLEYISDAENHQPHGHGRYVQEICGSSQTLSCSYCSLTRQSF